MSIKKYEIFLQTADLGSFTKASEMWGYTHSAISHIITSLEDELGVEIWLTQVKREETATPGQVAALVRRLAAEGREQ